MPCKTLEQCIGLLIWATSVALHLGSWLAPLYADLNSPPGSMHSIPPQMWAAFRASLTRDLKTSHSLPGLWITAGSKLLEISGRTLHCLEDIPRVPGASKPTWVRIADPNNPYTSLSKSSQQCLTWLASFRHFSRWRGHASCNGGDWGLGNHILPSGVVRRDLEHARHKSRVALPCQASAAVYRTL